MNMKQGDAGGCCSGSSKASAEGAVVQLGNELVLRIDQMDCPTEESLILKKLGAMPGVSNLSFNLMQRRLTVWHELADPAPIVEAIRGLDMVPVIESGNPGAQTPASDLQAEVTPPPAVPHKKWLLIGVGSVAAITAEAVAWGTGNENSWPVIALAVFAIVASGTGTYTKGWIALKNLNLNINALMSIAVTGAVIIGQWPEAAMVMVLFALAELIETLSLDRARNAIRGLMAMTPDKATVRQADGTWQETEAARIEVSAVVRVKPGERIPLDGVLTVGQSAVNQAPITGESIPVAKVIGDTVFAGTINETGSFEYRVTAAQTNSTLSRIIKAVEEAQGSRAPTQRFVDQFAKIYTPIVFLMAVIVAVAPPLMFGLPWIDWVYKALVLLVIACPCALVISTPVTIVTGLAAAAKAGILIKGGVYLEEGRKLKLLALDKTGTITQGKPVVTDFITLKDDVNALSIAAALAGRSDHPVSSAVSMHWQKNMNGAVLGEITEFAAITGRGVKGRHGGQWIYLGNHRMVEELGICSPETESVLNKLEAEGKTTVVICDETAPLAIIGVADTIRQTSREAIADLHTLGVRTVMLTGDNRHTAEAIAKSVGIDEVRSDLLPEDKLAAINDALGQNGTVGMVGDGINDAPALAKASIGFAMGAAGTDTAIETADVALMNDDLRKVPQFIRLSIRAAAILKQNIAIALGIKLVFFVLAIAGMASLWMAVFADMGASLLVVFNGLRLARAVPVNTTMLEKQTVLP
jgi:Cd2+/Zn2+-exporting ATPase